jgi:flagellar basal body-associated protein FliL
MLTKIILIFLIAMAALAVFGRYRFPGLGKSKAKKTAALAKPEICPKCGKYQIGKVPCACQSPSKGV